MTDEEREKVRQRMSVMSEGQQSIVAMKFLSEEDEEKAHESGDIIEATMKAAEEEGRIEQLNHEIRFVEAMGLMMR